jgi:hypothetical protein
MIDDGLFTIIGICAPWRLFFLALFVASKHQQRYLNIVTIKMMMTGSSPGYYPLKEKLQRLRSNPDELFLLDGGTGEELYVTFVSPSIFWGIVVATSHWFTHIVLFFCACFEIDFAEAFLMIERFGVPQHLSIRNIIPFYVKFMNRFWWLELMPLQPIRTVSYLESVLALTKYNAMSQSLAGLQEKRQRTLLLPPAAVTKRRLCWDPWVHW